MIKVEDTKLAGVKLITMAGLFQDHRGLYGENYSKKDYELAGINLDFKSHTYSRSHHNVLRGLHGDSRTWKLISCLGGEFYLIVLNFDRNSKQFGQWERFTISEDNRRQVLVPPNFANGHYVTSESAIFFYYQSEYYLGAENQFTVRWDDPKFEIKWPFTGEPILSKRDKEAPYVQ